MVLGFSKFSRSEIIIWFKVEKVKFNIFKRSKKSNTHSFAHVRKAKFVNGFDIWWLVSTLSIELRLLHDYFGKFSTQVKKYYFHVEESMLGDFNPHEVRLKWTLWGGEQMGSGTR